MQEISSEREDADIREYLGICNAILMGELGQAGRDYLESIDTRSAGYLSPSGLPQLREARIQDTNAESGVIEH